MGVSAPPGRQLRGTLSGVSLGPGGREGCPVSPRGDGGHAGRREGRGRVQGGRAATSQGAHLARALIKQNSTFSWFFGRLGCFY